jgi:hypothetical protein
MSGHPNCPPHPHFSLLREKLQIQRDLPEVILGGYKPVKDIDLPPPKPPLRLPSRIGNFKLKLQLYNLLNANHCLLNLMNQPLAGDWWLCLSSGPSIM